jgi:hypothetical protein
MLPEGAKPILNGDALPGAESDRASAGQGRSWGKLLAGVFVFSVVVGFGSLLAYFFVQNRDGALEPSAIPVVRADPRPMKLRPETPGGIEVPFQNTQIYDRVGQQSAGAAASAGRPGAPAAANRPVERLLPGPEAPLPRPMPPPAPVASIPATPDVAPPPNAVVVAPPPPPPVAAARSAPPPAQLATPAPSPAIAPPPPVAAARSAPPPVQLATPAPSAVAPPPPPVPQVAQVRPAVSAPAPVTAAQAGGVRIQLASVRAEADAQREWGRLQRQHGDVLGGLSPSYTSADLGDRGVYIRLQAGPFPVPEAARAACETLRARGVGCNVVR